MTNLKFGIFNANFNREYITNVLNTVHHYDGQLIVSEGHVCSVIDPCFAHNLAAVKLAFNNSLSIKNYLANQYEKMARKADKNDTPIVKYTPEDIFFFKHEKNIPITWFDHLDEAVAASKAMPEQRTIATSTPLITENTHKY